MWSVMYEDDPDAEAGWLLKVSQAAQHPGFSRHIISS
jgi:hypothetical protein